MVEIEQPVVDWPFRSAAGSWTFIELDPPTGFEYEDGEVPPAVGKAFEDAKLQGVRLGGWPSAIQSYLQWGPPRPPQLNWERQIPGWKPPAFLPEYAMELTWIRELDLMFGDAGSVYFGRGKVDPKYWIIEVQSC